MNLNTLLFALLVVFAAAFAAPIDKRDGPVLALPGAGESAGKYLSRLITPIPLIGSLAVFLGLPPPK
ncbi:hypothetical protein GQ54DRAFT_298507 [Martensiomyces pterosporus]|nr:hypothetical protein GQ54DRAFT_298507 [Martensiomyces pterosporus]